MAFMTHEWATLLMDYWPSQKRISDKDVRDAQRWEDELCIAMRSNPPTDSELCDVLREMSRGDQKYAPSLKELRIGLCKHRKAENAEFEPPAESCALCQQGWLSYWPNGRHTFPQLVVPCTCTPGMRVLFARYEPAHHNAVKRLCDLAVKDARAWLSEAEELSRQSGRIPVSRYQRMAEEAFGSQGRREGARAWRGDAAQA